MNNKECTRLAVGNKAGQKRIGVGWVYGPGNWDASPSAGLYLTKVRTLSLQHWIARTVMLKAPMLLLLSLIPPASL